MGVLYKYKSCPDGFIVFICGTTCVSILKNELVMRNIDCGGNKVCVVLASMTGQFESQNQANKVPLNLFLLRRDQQILCLA